MAISSSATLRIGIVESHDGEPNQPYILLIASNLYYIDTTSARNRQSLITKELALNKKKHFCESRCGLAAPAFTKMFFYFVRAPLLLRQ